MTAECRLVILNYNGRDLLELCLPSIQKAVEKSRTRAVVTVLDNQSVDDSRAFVAAHFPEMEFVSAPSNRIFCSYNAYLEAIPEEWAILLNNDLKVDEGFIDPLIEALKKDDKAFFSTPKALNFTTSDYEGSLSKMEFRWGLLWGSARFKGYEAKSKRSGLTMQCGFGAFRRKPFLELGGFDDLYLPGTVEDADLCFRAYRQGWKGLYCPDSVVHHIGQASFKKAFGVSGIRRLNRRNLYLFVWKNIRDPWLLLQHLFFLPFQLGKYALLGQKDFLLGFFEALKRFPAALERRRVFKKEPSVVSDRQIFAISRSL